jgi:hypothetical protein
MTRVAITSNPAAPPRPWFLDLTIDCPNCGWQFSLTPADIMPLGGPYGTQDTVWHFWRELVEGDPTTAPVDQANYHLDPAQVYGPCPNCGWMNAVRGPHYGMAKTQDITSDPAISLIQQYVQTGAVAMTWRHLLPSAQSGIAIGGMQIVGLFLDITNTIQMVSADGMYATGVARDLTDAINAAFSFGFAMPHTRITTQEALGYDADLCNTLARMGLMI